VYGENSLEVGKELKTIASIYIAMQDYKQAENNLKKALKIFHDLGDQRLVREVKVKIASLQIQQRQ
jgi:tetratricopeptide (TPR) repeat protein